MIKFTNHELQLIEVAKKFMQLNENLVLTGSLMCKIRGIDLKRECHDLDLLFIQDFAPNVKIPLDLELTEKGFGSDGCSIKYFYSKLNLDIDVLSTGDETIDIIDNIKLGSLNCLYQAKVVYSKQDNDSKEKHLNDIKILINHINV